ncbi:MAG: helix-turn-helix transcriptional regulator, partial [Hydrogenophaga sp.]|uniref:helix-turn-helix transcriptional regulator n=1 Tax=Hydrogenophaga sp. TaxID=1904254 RepID=UPI0040372302
MELKTWVKNAREHAGMTIEQLGSAVGRSKAAAGFWETGKTKPSYAQVQKISLVTGWPGRSSPRRTHRCAWTGCAGNPRPA